MNIAILTSGILPVPAVQGGAVENLIDFYLEYNNKYKIHDITVYSVYDKAVKKHSALISDVNHYEYIKTRGFVAKIKRRIYKNQHNDDFYNYHIEYFFEEIYKRISKKTFDLIILENRPGYALKLSQRGYKNIILHLHNDLLNNNTPYYKEIFNSLNKIITVSKYIKSRVETIGLSNKISVVYNGIDTKLFHPSNNRNKYRNKLGINKDDYIIIFTGRLIEQKGIKELLQAILLLKEYHEIKLIILGSSFFDNNCKDNIFVKDLKNMADEIKDNITFTGFIPYNKVHEYLETADIAVVPSIWEEPFGLTCIEANAMGLPLITTKVGGIPEIVDIHKNIILETNRNLYVNISKAILEIKNHPDKYRGNKIEDVFTKEYYSKSFFESI